MHPKPPMGVASPVSSPMPDAVIIAAARIWRGAIDSGTPAQPALHALLEPAGHDMLAPVFDSIMRLCEQHFDRRVCAGCPLTPSGDETLLCRLIADPALLDRVGPCRASAVTAGSFATALRSLRIMLELSAAPALN